MQSSPRDTIVALSSSLPGAFRAVVRLSGDRAQEIVTPLFDGTSLHVASTRVPCSLYVFRAPRSYTREDVVEIHTIASRPLVQLMIDELCARGARPAQPGEFTLRAYLNGRLDLAQAEAVLAVIESQSADEAEAALSGLQGEFSKRVAAVEERLLNLCAEVEAGIDFVDQDIEIISADRIAREIDEIRRALEEIVRESHARLGTETLTVMLYGAPNAGKSTLFNRLVPQADAIVSEVPGTTRDVLFGDGAIEEFRVRFADSAGIFEAQGPDLEAVRKTREFVKTVDVVLLVVDASAPVEMEEVRAKPHLVAVNKMDVARPDELLRKYGEAAVAVSAKTGAGVDELRRRLAALLRGGLSEASGARFALSARQLAALRNAAYCVRAAGVAQKLGMEFAAFDLREAANELGSLTGRNVTDDILTRIFSRFCIGK